MCHKRTGQQYTLPLTSSVFDCAGTLPSSWSASNSLPHLRTLNLTDNLLNGTLPAQWGSQAQAFPSLEVLDVALNNLNGTLPSTWCGAGFPVSNLPHSHVFTCQPSWCLPMWPLGLLLGTLAAVFFLARSSTLWLVTIGSMLSSFRQLIGHWHWRCHVPVCLSATWVAPFRSNYCDNGGC